MRKIIIILLSITSQIGSAQECKKLPDSYFFDRSNSEITPKSIKNSANYEKIILNKGNYFIDNEKFYFKFSIDKNGLLAGSAILKFYKKKTFITDMSFFNGIIVSSNTKIEETQNLYSKTELKDSIYNEEVYNENGDIASKVLRNFRHGQENEISTYYENGKISSEKNSKDQTFVVYYENGKLKRYTDDKNKFGKEYDESGKLDSQYYTNNDGFCSERYDDGVLISKKCENKKGWKEYFYENGKMTYFTVYDSKEGGMSVFDSNNKLKPVQKIPQVAMLKMDPTEIKSPVQEDLENKVYGLAEIKKIPEYPNGIDALHKFFHDNFIMPDEEGLKGKVYLSFIIEKDGSLSDKMVIRDIGFGTGKEAIRVLNKSQKWIPGEHNGTKVRCRYIIPVSIP